MLTTKAVVFAGLYWGWKVQGTPVKFKELNSAGCSSSGRIWDWIDHRGIYVGGPPPPTPNGNTPWVVW